MTTTRYYVASTLDGFIADSDNRIEWLLRFGFDEFQSHFDAFMADIGAIVMGSTTYEFLLDEGTDAWPYDGLPTWVFTHRDLPRVPDAQLHFADGDVSAVHASIIEAASGRDVWVVGGGDMARQYANAGLLDELLVTVMPVVLGSGRPLIPVDETLRLSLLKTTPFPSGAIELAYRVGP